MSEAQLPTSTHQERIARALADWSNDRPWETRHWRNQRHWMLVAEALMSNEPQIVDPVLAYVQARKTQMDGAFSTQHDQGGNR